MSISEDCIKTYFRVPKKYLCHLDCRVRFFSQQRNRLNPIIDFDKLLCSKLTALGIRDFYVDGANGNEASLIVFEPHNFPDVYHLNLAESSYVRHKDQSEDILRLRSRYLFELGMYSEFEESCARRLVSELLIRMGRTPNSIFRIVKNLLKFARISGCIKKDVKPISKSILNAMFRQEQEFGSDVNLTVEVLKTLCVLQEHKKTLLHEYSSDLLGYVLRCCTAAKFDFERYCIYDNRRKRISCCAVTECMFSPPLDFRKLRILLQYGFELQAFDLISMKNVYKLAVGDYQSNAGDLRLGDSTLRFSRRRRYILLLFLSIVCYSFGRTPCLWSDCTKLLFNSIPDAYICELEVRSFLKSAEFNDNCNSFLALCTEFKGSYAASRAPRTLKHLSRCVVRKVLRNNVQLPNGIGALSLPDKIQSYLEDLKD